MTKQPEIKAAIFASGNGTNAQNLIDYAAQNYADRLHISCIICDKPGAGVIKRAEAAGIPVHIIPKTGTKQQHETEILATLAVYEIDWIFLAGYMRILGHDLLSAFYDPALNENRVINIHPSLLPEFRGKDAYERSFESRRDSGITVHFVNDEIDEGTIILQSGFPRKPEDSFDDFQKRGMELEYQLYRQALDLLCDNQITGQGAGHERSHQNRS